VAFIYTQRERGKEEWTHKETGIRRVVRIHEQELGLNDNTRLCGRDGLGQDAPREMEEVRVARTVLADGRKTLFELPAGSADKG
jgi:hypothetical protein